jgi:iron complex outermembrane receptor protein
VADLELAYTLKKATLGAGVQNAFNALPDRQVPGTAFNNIRTFPRNAPFGFNGRFVYARASYRF